MNLPGQLLLGIETSCDETACSVVEAGGRVLSSVVASQVNLHRKFGGVVPEIACRAHLEAIIPVIEEALTRARVSLQDLQAVAVTHTPGLVGALLIGVAAAKALAWTLNIPLVGINHLYAHVYANFIGNRQIELPFVALVVSGGHTVLFEAQDVLDMKMLGGTVDDAAGEAFDKVASILGLGYPGGPEIERLAREGDPQAIDFPRSFMGKDSYDFSFSGIKTAVLYYCYGKNVAYPRRKLSFSHRQLADIAASFQEAVVEVLVTKTIRAAKNRAARSVLIGGGVSCNQALRERMSSQAEKEHLRCYCPRPELCLDNAAMVAGLGWELLRHGRLAPAELAAVPHLQV